MEGWSFPVKHARVLLRIAPPPGYAAVAHRGQPGDPPYTLWQDRLGPAAARWPEPGFDATAKVTRSAVRGLG
jgi:hypothetical protein